MIIGMFFVYLDTMRSFNYIYFAVGEGECRCSTGTVMHTLHLVEKVQKQFLTLGGGWGGGQPSR